MAGAVLRRRHRRGARHHVRGGPGDAGRAAVVAIYSTFLQRAYDSIIHDVAIQKLPVIFCMDRAGMSAKMADAHGLYDIAYMLAVPHMTVTAPKMRRADRTAGCASSTPTARSRCAIRATRRPAKHRRRRGAGVPYGSGKCSGRKGLRDSRGRRDVQAGAAAAEQLATDGLDVSVVNARFLKPMDREMLDVLAQTHKLLVTVEDGTVVNASARRSRAGADHRPRVACGPRRARPHV